MGYETTLAGSEQTVKTKSTDSKKTSSTFHKLIITNLVALSLWRKVAKRRRNELRMEMVLRPNLNTAFHSICVQLGINLVYNFLVNKSQSMRYNYMTFEA